jgi:hypothetical protein
MTLNSIPSDAAFARLERLYELGQYVSGEPDETVVLQVVQGHDHLAEIHVLLDGLTSAPSSHDLLDLTMAESLHTTEWEEQMPWLLLVGPPSRDKDTLRLSKDAPAVLYVDDLTKASFGSAYVPQGGKKRAPDLLERMQQQHRSTLIIRDLTTLFSQPEKAVRALLGAWQSIYQGTYTRATGTTGLTEYKVPLLILAAITPQAVSDHHNYMAEIGARFLYYRVPELTAEQEERGFELLRDPKARQARREALQRLVVEHLAAAAAVPFDGLTPEQDTRVRQMARLIARGRAIIARARLDHTRVITGTQQEGPFRAYQQLVNLGRRLAAIHLRSHVAEPEMAVLRLVALSTMAPHRAAVVGLWEGHRMLTPTLCADLLGCSKQWASQVLQDLARVEIAVKAGEGAYEPHPDFTSLIQGAPRPRGPVGQGVSNGK